MIVIDKLDELVKKYETVDFIKNDPISIPHKFHNKKDIELAAFIASLFAYGKRELFLKKLNILFDLMQNEPYNFITDFTQNNKSIDNIEYRFAKNNDIKQIILILSKIYKNNNTLEDLFNDAWNKTSDIKSMLKLVVDYFYSQVTLDISSGFYHLLPNPDKNSPLKRFNMFLRWVVRDGIVDLGIWNFMNKKDLLIPLDTHVARISRELNLLTRNTNDFKSVILLTNKLKELDNNDPIKYDFALFGYGVSNQKEK